MSVYGQFQYGTALYGLPGFPVSPSCQIFDFCYPSDSSMLQIFSYPQSTAYRSFGVPNLYYDVNNDLCMMSDDTLNSGFRIDTSITNDFTLQFTFQAPALPQDFSDPTSKRFFVAAYNQYAKMMGILLSADKGIALSRDGITVDEVLPDSADLFDDGDYFTFRLAVDATNNRGHLYVTEADLVQHIGHQLRYSFPLQDTPAGEVDHVNIDVVGTVADPTSVCLDCICLADNVTMNHRPVAVPGPDQTRSEGQYASFDGSGSYDPDPGDIIVQYWWTITETPSNADILLEGSAATAADPSGFTNKITGSVGDFSDIRQGDLFFVDDYKSPVMYVAGDGSWLVTIDHVFPESLADTEWSCIQQSAWDGDWVDSSMFVVLSSESDPSTLTPSVGDTYLVLPGAVGAWLNKQNMIATWNGSSWDFVGPEDEDVLYDINANVSYRYLYLAPAPPPYSGLWYADEPRPWELGHWSGRTPALGGMLAANRGLYVIELMVNDGELDSIPVEVLLNCYMTDVVMGLTPDLTFMWNYLSDFWDLVIDKEKVESFWSAFTQILSGDMLALWQHDYSKDILSIQRTFQRQWLNFDPLYEEPNYEEIPATIENSVDVSGYSATPNVQVPDPTDPATMIDSETAYDLGILVSGITDANVLVLDGVCFPITRTEDGATTVVITSDAITIGSDRPKAWMIRPTVISRFSDYTQLGAAAGDTALFEVVQDADISEVAAYVWGVKEGVLAFDDTDISSLLADPDITVRFKSLLRRSSMLVDDLVTSIPRLQEVIAMDRVEGAPAPLIEERDFRVVDVTTVLNQDVRWIEFLEAWFERLDNGFDGSYSAVNEFTSANADFITSLGEAGTDLTAHVLVTPEGRFRLLEVVDANTIRLHDDALQVGLADRDWEVRQLIEPPESLWAEITFLDNRPTIEDNFGRLIGFTLDDLEERTDNLDYLSAVQGLWYSIWFGRTLENLRIGSQILLGLPFSEESGTIIDIKSPHDSTRDRILLQPDDNAAAIRSYYFPTVVGIANSETTGVPLVVGDHVEQFDPLSKGVQVDDWESIPDWANDLIGAGNMWEPQKIHSYLVKVSADVFDINNLTFLISFLLRIKPKYTYPVFVVLKQIIDTVDVGDAIVYGPVIPTEGDYPDTWHEFTPAIGWLPPGPNEENDAAGAINRVTPPTFDITTRWPNDRFVTPMSLNPSNPFGNLHLADNPGRTPDGWEAPWSGIPSSHEKTRDEGPRRYDATDESGHYIHKYDSQLFAYNPISGVGDSITYVGFPFPICIIDDSAGLFHTSMIGEEITIAGAADPNHNGTFLIIQVPGPTQLWYVNPAATAGEPSFTGTWSTHWNEPTEDFYAARDGHMDLSTNLYWSSVGTPTVTKVTSPVYVGTRSLEIVAGAGEGVSNPFGTSRSDPTPIVRSIPALAGSGGGYQVGVTGYLRITSGQVIMSLRDQDGVVIAEVKRNQPNNQWLRFVLHCWDWGGTTESLSFRAVGGPGGATFHLDAVEAFIYNMPWSQVGYDRSFFGRTGGYTPGGDPDEYLQASLHLLVP